MKRYATLTLSILIVLAFLDANAQHKFSNLPDSIPPNFIITSSFLDIYPSRLFIKNTIPDQDDRHNRDHGWHVEQSSVNILAEHIFGVQQDRKIKGKSEPNGKRDHCEFYCADKGKVDLGVCRQCAGPVLKPNELRLVRNSRIEIVQ